MRLANFVIKWSKSISCADAAWNDRLKWLASSHLYYRWIELIFKVRPIMGFFSSRTSSVRKGKGHFHVSSFTLLHSVCLYPLSHVSFTLLFSCFRFILFYVIVRSVRESVTLIRVQGAKKMGESWVFWWDFWWNWVSKNMRRLMCTVTRNNFF